MRDLDWVRSELERYFAARAEAWRATTSADAVRWSRVMDECMRNLKQWLDERS